MYGFDKTRYKTLHLAAAEAAQRIYAAGIADHRIVGKSVAIVIALGIRNRNSTARGYLDRPAARDRSAVQIAEIPHKQVPITVGVSAVEC